MYIVEVKCGNFPIILLLLVSTSMFSVALSVMLKTSVSIFLSDGEEETEDGGGIWSLLHWQKSGNLKFTALQ